MRKIGAVVAVLLLMSSAAASANQVGQYRDTFESGTWSGSDGSVEWSTSWATQGTVSRVTDPSCESGSTCVRMGALTTLLGTLRATRSADTSLFDGDLNLRYSLTAASGLGGSLSVRVRVGGGSWETVKTYALGSPFTDQPTIALGDHLRSEGFELRFEYSAVLLGGPVFVDNVEIQGAIAEPTTTTSTTTTTTSTTSTTTSTTTTTTIPTTTTTKPPPTTTTTGAVTPTTTGSGSSGSDTSTPAATAAGAAATTVTTTTTRSEDPRSEDGEPVVGRGAEATDPSGEVAEPGSGGALSTGNGIGIRAAARGLQANFDGDLYGEVRAVSSLTAVDVQAEYNMAVEVIRASWGWMVLLALLVGYSIISGLDRRRGAVSTGKA